MVVFLNVFKAGDSGKKKFGTLEIGENAGAVEYFEWRGMNGTDDGGTCSWVKNSSNFYVLRLTSNRNQNLFGDVSDESWENQTIPTKPYFKPDASGYFWFYGPTARTEIFKFERM